MYTRGLVLGAVVTMSVFGAASCGDDPPANTAQKCDPMTQTMSVPHSTNDPCPQNEMHCPYPMYTAVTVCMPDGVWNPMCSCVPTSSLGNVGGGGANAAGDCGNRMVDAPAEQCDPLVPITTTCAMLMPGTTGDVDCYVSGPMACKYDVTRCMMMNTGGGGNGQ